MLTKSSLLTEILARAKRLKANPTPESALVQAYCIQTLKAWYKLG